MLGRHGCTALGPMIARRHLSQLRVPQFRYPTTPPQPDATMFGALNRFIARLDSDPPPQSSNAAPNDSSYGFQILRNTNAELPIEPWFDFIIGINGHVVVSGRLSFARKRTLTICRMTQIHSYSPGKSAIAEGLHSPLISGAPKYSITPPVVYVVSDVDIGPANTYPDHRRTSCASVTRSHPPTSASECYAEHLAHPLHTFSTVSSTSRRPSATLGLHPWNSIGDSSRRGCSRGTGRGSSQ
jgi:hypothetical protein